ncbi:MAG: threonine/serine exporter family protein [Coriobacteriia bacterium]|nr:threonine/serine exporter family protein [Coriobacteriia bacterium]
MNAHKNEKSMDTHESKKPLSAYKNKVLMLAVRAGEIMLKSGAEVYRAESTIERICHACDIEYVQSFITTTGIIVSVGADEARAEVQTAIRRVRHGSTDLEKVSQINTFIRRFTAAPAHTEESINEGLKELDRIDALDGFKLPIRLAALVVIAFFFTMVNGGSPIDGACAIGVGVAAYLFSLSIGHLKINRFIVVFASCFFAEGLALLIFNLGFCSSLSAMIIGSIIVYLPGVAIVNAVRDLLSGDMLSGVSRTVESLLVAIAIAGGAGMLLRFAPAPLHADVSTQFAVQFQFLFALIGTMGIAIMVNIPRRYLLPVGFIAGCGFAVYELMLAAGSSQVMGCFIATCTIALLAEIATRLSKDAATLFIIPAIFPLVPGGLMYKAMTFLLANDTQAALRTGLEALFVAGSIAVALLVIISLTRVISSVYQSARRRTQES